MADFPTAAVDRLGDYNGARYDAQTNPYGMAIGGHRQNFPQSLNDSASVAAYIAATAQEVRDDAQAVVDNLALAVEARTLAQRWASNPEDQEVLAGLFSALHYARKASASATQAATFNPALYARRDGATFTGQVIFPASVAGAASLRIPVGQAEPTANNAGDIWLDTNALRLSRAGAKYSVHDSGNLITSTDAEADAGTGTTTRTWTPARIWRAVRAALPLFTQAQAEAGAVTTAGAWSPQRDAQAIAALAPRGTNIRGSFNAQSVSSGVVELGSADFTATGPAVFVAANLSLDGVSSTIVRARLDIVRVDNGAVVYQGPTIAMNHQGSNLERLPAAADFVGLARGVLYRARVIASADAGTVSVAGFINGICA